MSLPTSRRIGLGGTCALGGSAYAGADIQEWTLEVNQATLEASTKADSSEVSQIGRKSATGTLKKLVATTAFAKTSLLGTVLTLTLTTGSGATLGGTGDMVFTGNVIVTKVGYQSPDGMESEDLSWKSTGAFTLKDS